MVANSHPGQPAGSVPQRTDRLPLRRAARVKRWCKRPPVRRATGAARQTPPGARSDRMRSRAARPSIRVDRTRRPATVVADGWSPLRKQDRTRPTGRPTPIPACRTTTRRVVRPSRAWASARSAGSGRPTRLWMTGAVIHRCTARWAHGPGQSHGAPRRMCLCRAAAAAHDAPADPQGREEGGACFVWRAVATPCPLLVKRGSPAGD